MQTRLHHRESRSRRLTERHNDFARASGIIRAASACGRDERPIARSNPEQLALFSIIHHPRVPNSLRIRFFLGTATCGTGLW